MQDLSVKLLSKIEVINECWLWLGCRDSKGYGYIGTGGGKVGRAHRVSYSTFVREIPDNYLVLHKCDNPPCINPDHLFTGTQKDNMRDMWNKGRGPKRNHKRGDNPAAKLKESDILAIRNLLNKKIKQQEIADRFNVSSRLISRIKVGLAWK